MPRKLIVTGVKLLLASLAVGILLSVLGITPRDILDWAGIKAQDAVEVGRSLIDWAWTYIILGAAVVIPVWLILLGWRYLRKRA